MTTLSEWYASAPTHELMISALTIDGREGGGAEDYVRLCDGFEDMNLGVDGVLQPFQACSLALSLPARNTSGQQELTFAVGGINPQAQAYVDAATEAGTPITIRLRQYMLTDKMNPANELELKLKGGVFEGEQAQFVGSYQDLLNQRWPRELYTTINAPGLVYMV